MQEPIKRTDVQNQIRFLNDNKIPYDIYIGKYFKEDCIIIETANDAAHYYDIDSGKIIMSFCLN